MGNVLKPVQDLSQALKRRASVQSRSEPVVQDVVQDVVQGAVQGAVEEVAQEDLLQAELTKLQQVDLWRVQWGLSQNLLPDFPPVPPHWLRSADATSTAKTMLKCYHEQGALAMLNAVLTMIGLGHRINYTAEPPRPRLILAPKPDPDFVQTWRRKLISRMQQPDIVLDRLQDAGILKTANREAINIFAARKEKNRALVDLVLRKGDEAQQVFYKALSQSEPFLLQELEGSPIRIKNPSEMSDLAEMLEFLVSEELRCFQWLVSHMSDDGCSPIGGEQLQHADRPTTQRLLGEYFGSEQGETVAKNILLKIVPMLSVCLRGKAVTSQSSSDIRSDLSEDTSVVEITPEVFKDGNMFRLRCFQPGIFHCRETGLLFVGVGDVVYQVIPWDVDFLCSKGLRPAGPLFRFTVITGSFHQLYLPHCQLTSDALKLSVAHVTGDSVDFITPGQVTEHHVIIDVSGFSCFGLVTPVASNSPISGLVLIFSQLSTCSLFILLLQRNVNLPQVIKDWKQRSGAEYVETIPDCELIPNQMYKMSAEPSTFIQPESSKFVNFSDYNNFLASFQVQLAADVRRVELQLMTSVTPLPLIGWLFGSIESVVWRQVVQMKGQ
ncbi:Caspase recruitment domain-containing protein 8 [Collichthys lucidus]|uniref:Caspase recruitment domain-containing protein 8 n=1 Tax=Collichthys lucidus TaxID=240159 RepID=A0A4U5UKF4_COLLU|nr:Caspase recruitment domain-containing protein 8 [Collichthys lucidus]